MSPVGKKYILCIWQSKAYDVDTKVCGLPAATLFDTLVPLELFDLASTLGNSSALDDSGLGLSIPLVVLDLLLAALSGVFSIVRVIPGNCPRNFCIA
ncbi:hypothetical protein KEM55_000078 [Ascosphaera atra]|nr:hypothetical protein KEM55_000078 [Ascosphaera atra]